MGKPHIRLTVRRLLVLVAVVAFAIGATRLTILAGEYRQKAREHAWKARAYGTAMSQRSSFPIAFPDNRDSFDRIRSVKDYHVGLEKKYSHAATHPWLLVEPDPPEPICDDVVVSTCPY